MIRARAFGGAAPARAADYGYFVDVETEDQLLDLLSSQEIDQSTFDALQDLLNDGVDLSTADREELYALPNLTYDEVDKILLYRSQAGAITDPTVLVTAGILTERKLLALAAFLVESDGTRRIDLRGRLRLRSLYVVGDKEVPPLFFSARAATLKKKLDFAVVTVLTRNELGDVRWDPNRDALSAQPPSVHVRVPKFYAQYKTERWHLIAGTFRIGFGQRLTLDNTNRYNPNGIRPDDQVYNSRDLTAACHESSGEPFGTVCPDQSQSRYEGPDYKWPVRFRGVAIGFHSPETPRGWAQVYGFGSYETKGIYQYELYDRVKCSDPRSTDPDCSAPTVFVRQTDPLAPAPRFSYSTLPEMYNELTVGGNLSWFFNRRAHVGLTGYGSAIYWLTDGARLDFQEWSRTPYGGGFGAIGVDASVGVKAFDLGVEVSRSFDSQPEGGSWAAIMKGTLTFKKQEFEFSGRYFDPHYNNPYARPISAVDEFEGLRAANEAGFRVRHIGTFGDLELRSMLDIWGDILKQKPEIRFRTRAEYEVTPWFRPSLWLDVFDKNMLVNGNGQCFYSDATIEGEPVDCNGIRTQFGAQLKFVSRRGLTVAVRYLHKLIDDPHYPTSFRQDMSTWLTVMYSPVEWLRLRLRLRYLSEDLERQMTGEESIWAYLESIFQVKRTALIKLRYEVYAWIDQRASTQVRDPNPAHWLRLELEYRF